MNLLSDQVASYIERASWIRRMFEAGIELKKRYGEEAVCDFSLGNPDVPPPPAVGRALADLAGTMDRPFACGYMPNFGYPELRQALAGRITREQGTSVAPTDLIVTCGAAGAINALYRAILNPCEEVICPSPYFVEYGFYVENHGGRLVTAPSRPLTFDLDLGTLAAAVTDRTRAVLINSPNNPTGAVYSEDQLMQLAELLHEKNRGRERPIFLISDEPYRFLTYDGETVPSLLPIYPYTVVVTSFSKNLSLAGERVGYALVNPSMPEKEKLLAALVLTNRILGYVNAPAIGQKVLLAALDSQVDAGIYARRRDVMADVLAQAGYSFTPPRGGFYFFPQAPGGDDVAFCKKLLEERILAVPGSGFGCPGHFRLAFCVDEAVIRRALDGFTRAKNAA